MPAASNMLTCNYTAVPPLRYWCDTIAVASSVDVWHNSCIKRQQLPFCGIGVMLLLLLVLLAFGTTAASKDNSCIQTTAVLA